MSILNNSLLLGAPAAAAGGISRSLRFNSSDSAYLSRTPGTAGNRTTWTWAAWVKRTNLGGASPLFCAGPASSADTLIYFDSGSVGAQDSINWFDRTNPSKTAVRITTQVFRDASAWYHFVFVWDSNNGTAADRMKIYVNGTPITTFSSTTNPSPGALSALNNNVSHAIGSDVPSTAYFSGYLTNIHFIDGQALTPSSFTETDATTGQLIPKTYSGSYGTNGYNLLFADNSSNTASTLGKDTSPNGNNWTPNNLQTATGGPTSVASASGALPIYNTTDTYGATKGSGDRTDSNSSSIVLAIPMDGANNGTTFTDESATIKGSGSAKSITRNGDTKTSTAQSKFYGSSGYFDGSGDYLTNSDITDFNFDTGDFTIECWIYHSSTGSNEGYSDTGTSISSATGGQWFLYKTSSDKVSWGQHGAGAIITSATSIVSQAWTHIAICRASSAVKIYINGILDAQATSSVNFNNGGTLRIGAVATPYYLNGYMQDFRVYKGVAKYTSNFNPPSSTQNPTIAAGNDSLVDVPTSSGTDLGVGGEVRGNYCTLNPLNKNTNAAAPTNGNLDYPYNPGTAAWLSIAGTIGVTSGKYYWEITPTVVGGNGVLVGIANQIYNFVVAGSSVVYLGHTANSWAYYSVDGKIYTNSSGTSYGNSYTSNDVIGVALDMDSGKCWFSKNGTWQNSGSPTGGTNAGITGLTGSTIFPGVSLGDATPNTALTANFGQRAFAYTAPSGFKALCTTNLPGTTITTSGTYTGNGVADGPFVYLNGVPTAMTIGGNAVTFGTHADKLSNGFKIRTTSTTYNQNASTYSYSITTTGDAFKYSRAQPNP